MKSSTKSNWKCIAAYLGVLASEISAAPYFIREFSPMPGNLNYGQQAVVGNTLFFVGKTELEGAELWRSDGTPTGTVLVKDIVPGVASSSPKRMISMGNLLFFEVNYQLWVSDGTDAGTISLGVGLINSFSGITSLGNILYFGGAAAVGNGLWKSDGTLAGTQLVKATSTSFNTMGHVGNRLYFEVYPHIYTSDGTSAGTTLVYNGSPYGGANLATGESSAYFSAADGSDGVNGPYYHALYALSGTSYTKIIRVKGSTAAMANGFSSELTPVGNTLYFGYTGIPPSGANVGYELYRYVNGSMSLVKDVNPSFGNSYPSNIKKSPLANAAFFTTEFAAWHTQGTDATTVQIANTRTYEHTPSGTGMYFQKYDAATGYEIWFSSGTVSGTHITSETIPGPDSIGPSALILADKLFFRASNAQHFRLWAMDIPHPSVSLQTISNSTTNVELQASINPNALPTTAKFEYGPTQTYGTTQTLTLAPTNGATAQFIAIPLGSLSPGTLYHGRLTAQNDGVASTGDFIFNTISATQAAWLLAQFGSSASNPISADNADPDLDGQTNLFEYIAQTNPNDASSKLNLTTLALSSQLVSFRLGNVRPNVRYTIQASPNLIQWTDLTSQTFDAASANEIITSTPPASANQYFRVKLAEAP